MRALAAIAGSYVLAGAIAVALTRLLPRLALLPRADAMTIGTLVSFWAIPAAAIWAFAAPSPARAWLWLAAPIAVLLGAAWLAGSP